MEMKRTLMVYRSTCLIKPFLHAMISDVLQEDESLSETLKFYHKTVGLGLHSLKLDIKSQDKAKRF